VACHCGRRGGVARRAGARSDGQGVTSMGCRRSPLRVAISPIADTIQLAPINSVGSTSP
jgi:hypothetical protein